jgi:hypothetical protein
VKVRRFGFRHDGLASQDEDVAIARDKLDAVARATVKPLKEAYFQIAARRDSNRSRRSSKARSCCAKPPPNATSAPEKPFLPFTNPADIFSLKTKWLGLSRAIHPAGQCHNVIVPATCIPAIPVALLSTLEAVFFGDRSRQVIEKNQNCLES